MGASERLGRSLRGVAAAAAAPASAAASAATRGGRDPHAAQHRACGAHAPASGLFEWMGAVVVPPRVQARAGGCCGPWVHRGAVLPDPRAGSTWSDVLVGLGCPGDPGPERGTWPQLRMRSSTM
eukprot:scaffold2004_cov420-Prasinococcus_capsulatus_cf.AAC.12